MPSNYTHYRFARRMLPKLDARVAKYPGLYYTACHGADPMFYFDAFKPNPVRAIADEYHKITGRELFTAACDRLRGNCSDGEYAYLFGFLTHYCMDSTCHPFVNGLCREGVCGHAALETEFDRFLMEKDGIRKPHRVDLSEHVKLRDEEYAIAASFYPPLTAEEFRVSVEKMHKANGLLSGNSCIPRFLVEWYLNRIGGDVRDQMMRSSPDPRTAHLDEELLSYYNRAEERFPELQRQLEACLRDGTPLDSEFDANFE